MEGATDELVINPPLLLIFARGQGDTPADVIATGREPADTLAGVLNVLLGNGYPVLAKAYEAVFRKDKKRDSKILSRPH